MGYKTTIAATLGTVGAFGLGYYKGNAAANGNPLPGGIDAAITYGTPVIGTISGFLIGAEHGASEGGIAGGLLAMIDGGFGAAIGGTVGLVAQGLGHLTGSVLGKYI